MGQVSQVPTDPRMSSPVLSAASGSQILIIMTEILTNLSQYSLTELGNFYLNLSTTLSVTPTALPKNNQ